MSLNAEDKRKLYDDLKGLTEKNILEKYPFLSKLNKDDLNRLLLACLADGLTGDPVFIKSLAIYSRK